MFLDPSQVASHRRGESQQPRIRIYKEYVPKQRRRNSSNQSARYRAANNQAATAAAESSRTAIIGSSSSHDSLESLFLKTRGYLISAASNQAGQQLEPNYRLVPSSNSPQPEQAATFPKSQSLQFIKNHYHNNETHTSKTTNNSSNTNPHLLVDKSCQVDIR